MNQVQTNGMRQVLLVHRAVIENNHQEVLLVRRADNDGYNSELWELPGGKVDAGQSLEEALDREVLEETGLVVETTSDMRFVASHVIHEGKYSGLTYVALFGIARVIAGRIHLSPEHSAYAWESYTDALEYDLTTESRNALHAFMALSLSNNRL